MPSDAQGVKKKGVDNLSKKLIIKDAAQRQLDKWAGKALRAVEKHIGPATENDPKCYKVVHEGGAMVRKTMSLDSAPVKELRKSDRVAVVEVQGRRARIIKDDFEGWVSLKTKHGDPIFQRCQWPHEKDTKHAFAVTFDKKWKAAQEAKAEQAEKEEAEPVAAGSSSSPLASQKQIRVKTAEEIAAAAAAAPPPLLAPPGSAAASGYAVRKPSLTGQTAPSTGLLDLMGDDSDVVNTTSSGNAYTSTESVPVNKTANANPFDMFDDAPGKAASPNDLLAMMGNGASSAAPANGNAGNDDFGDFDDDFGDFGETNNNSKSNFDFGDFTDSSASPAAPAAMPAQASSNSLLDAVDSPAPPASETPAEAPAPAAEEPPKPKADDPFAGLF